MRLPRNQFVRAANHFFEFAEAELGHDLAQFLRDELHEIHDVVRVAAEPRAQSRVSASRRRPGTCSNGTRAS